jgi:hypothetical protein
MSRIERTRIKWKTLSSRLGGLSVFGVGASWKAPEPERDVVRSVINVLEDKRALYANDDSEVRDHVNQSLLEIRKVLTDGINRVSDSSPAAEAFRLMRAACREFLTQPHSDPLLGKVVRKLEVPAPAGMRAAPQTRQALANQNEAAMPSRGISAKHEHNFFIALGKLRGVFGQQLALLGYLYRIDLEKDLASIVPPEPHSTDQNN